MANAPINGTAGNDNITGTSGNDYINGGDGNDNLKGGAGSDTLDGGAGSDILDGGSGDDVMIGGTGNDTYTVDSKGDVVIEDASAGIDLVKSYITYVLGANLENLTLMGNDLINGTGNELANSIKGNDSDNVLMGMAGNDQLDAGLGSDILAGGVGNDWAKGGGGADTFYFSVDDISPASAVDQIADLNFKEGDRIALSGYREGADRIIASYANLVRLTDMDPTVTVAKHGESGAADIVIAGPGGHSQTITVTDSTGSAWSLFSAAAVRPVATADVAATTERAPVTIDVLANDTGPELSITAVHGPSHAGDASIANGQIVFNPLGNFAYLAAGESTTVSLDYSIATAAGRTAASTIQVTVTGVNDVAEISGTDHGDVYEDGVATATGRLAVSDADHDQSAFQAGAVAGTFGTLSIDQAGAWTYTLDDNAEGLKTLNSGEASAEQLAVKSLDGTSHSVEITVHGSDEAPSHPLAYTGGGDPNDNDGVTGGGVLYTTVSTAGLRGANTLYGTDGADSIDAGNGNDAVYAWKGDDFISGGQGMDTAYGGSGNDTIQGNQAQDMLFGGSGQDVISGIQGDDVIVGGFGADTLTGNDGSDRFVFLDLRDTNDTITDFSTGDVIDLSNFSVGGVQYKFDAAVQATSFTASRDLIYHFDGHDTVVLGNTDGDYSTAEFMITLHGNPAIGPSSIVV